MSRKICVGSRESKLAVVQSEMVMAWISEHHPEMELSLLTMKTTGDKILDRTLDKIGGKGLFVKELDKALLENRSDMSVHSLKDMPMEVSEELPIVAFSTREDPRDVLVLPEGMTELDLFQTNRLFEQTPDAAVTGTLSGGNLCQYPWKCPDKTAKSGQR